MDLIELIITIVGIAASIIITYILTLNLKKKEKREREISDIREMLKGHNELLQSISTSLMIKSSLGDYEKRFERIEKGITRMETNLSEGVFDYKELDSNIDKITDKISELESKIKLDLGTLEEGVIEFRDNIKELNENVASMSNTEKAIQKDINELIEDMTDLKDDIILIKKFDGVQVTQIRQLENTTNELKKAAHKHPSGLVGEPLF